VCKFIFISGGCYSGTGKGLAASSIALLLKMRGESVQLLKFDVYLNNDTSLLSPDQHGETFVLDDKSQTDLDLGHYYRISSIELSSKNIWTAGKLYSELIEEGSKGVYLGKSLQIIPHLTNKIIEKIKDLGKENQIVVVEIGGTVGDIESDPFFEAIAQLKQEIGEKQFMLVHVAPIIWVSSIKEHKTKPLQNSVRELKKRGLYPDALICRTDREIDAKDKMFDKISLMTGVTKEAIFEGSNCSNIYQIPVLFFDCHLDDFIADKLQLKRNGVSIHSWRNLAETYSREDLPEINLGVVGKYLSVEDAYLSLKEAVFHAGVALKRKINIKWIDAEKLEEYTTLRGLAKFFEDISGVIIPGGFDYRGVEGKIKAVQYAREKKIPFLGICLGLQCAVIEFARNVCGISDAHSEEFKQENITPVIHWLRDAEEKTISGSNLRVGAYDCTLTKGSLVHQLYKKRNISERHRHRYEVNNDYLVDLNSKGLKVSGINPETSLVEMMEMDQSQHPYFVATQAHPEFKSRLDNPHPLFLGLIKKIVEKDD